MLKDATYKDKLLMLKTWFPQIVETIKNDLKNDHLKRDPQFLKQHLPGKNVNKITHIELAEAYVKAIPDSSEDFAEFICNRWLVKNTEVYDFFVTELEKINPNFSEIVELDASNSEKIVQGAIQQFGALKTYVFSVMNSVVFPEKTFKDLEKKVAHHVESLEVEAKVSAEKETLESLKKNQEIEIARLTDKYEKKLSGLQKKYITDVEGLKKQLAALQRKQACK